MKSERALVKVREAAVSGDLVRGVGYQYQHGTPTPAVELAAEDFRHLAHQRTPNSYKLIVSTRQYRGYDPPHPPPKINTAIQPRLRAMGLGGMIATMTIEEPTDTDIFLAYVDQVLCPKLSRT